MVTWTNSHGRYQFGVILVGSVAISVDAELGWGHHDYETPPIDRLQAARPGWSLLVDLFDRYEIPATWAVVGHLFLDTCDGEHPDHPAPDQWFAWEREAFKSRPELRFGDGLVDDLLDADVDHDVGCHSFSHVRFGDPETTRELARAEVHASVAAADDRGIEMESFVFPRNSIGHRDVLADGPFTCYRSVPSASQHGLLGPIRKLSRATLGEQFIVEPRIDEYGLVDVPQSLYLYGFEDPFSSMAEPFLGDPVLRMVRQGISQAVRDDGLLHVSLHPNDITTERKARRVASVLSTIDHARRRTSLDVETMRDVARRTLASSPTDSE